MRIRDEDSFVLRLAHRGNPIYYGRPLTLVRSGSADPGLGPVSSCNRSSSRRYRSTGPPVIATAQHAAPFNRIAQRPLFPYLESMEVHFTPEQEAELAHLAIRSGTNPERLVKDAALRLLQ